MLMMSKRVSVCFHGDKVYDIFSNQMWKTTEPKDAENLWFVNELLLY